MCCYHDYRLVIKRENNSIEVFSFDLTIDNPVDVANHLWGHDKH